MYLINAFLTAPKWLQITIVISILAAAGRVMELNNIAKIAKNTKPTK